MFGGLGSTELLIIAVVVLIFFGSKKLNELARGLGESTKEVKKVKKEYEQAVSGNYDEDKKVNNPEPAEGKSKAKTKKESKKEEVKSS